VRASRGLPSAAPVEAPFVPPAQGVWCDPRRVRVLRGRGDPVGDGPVVYWMSRERRVMDNWSLACGLEIAARANRPFHVVYVLDHERDSKQGARHRVFEIGGLQELAGKLKQLGIPFHVADAGAASSDASRNSEEITKNENETNFAAVPFALEKLNPSLVVCDFSPLRGPQAATRNVVSMLCPCDVPVLQVDARNVVPVWIASDKKEYAARTIRKKIMTRLPTFLTEFPNEEDVQRSARQVEAISSSSTTSTTPESVPNLNPDWDGFLQRASNSGGAPPVVSQKRNYESGETAALNRLANFCDRLRLYTGRNDPNTEGAQSGLSPYLRYGMLSAQRAALAVQRTRDEARVSAMDDTSMTSTRTTEIDPEPETFDPLADAAADFIEELVVRRELAENFVAYTCNYDTLEGTAAGWAMESLRLHESDTRDPCYTLTQLEAAKTHDELWNAAQLELTELGKMHGFMRMYWAKKILEWTSEGPAVAFEIALHFNDKYSLDGRDPNGFVGVAWAIAGTHDQGWKERNVFGKIRYMNYAGCKRKFKIDQYVERIQKEIREENEAREEMARARAGG